MAYNAKITNIGEPNSDGAVVVTFDFCNDDTPLQSGLAVSGDPVSIRDMIRAKATELATAYEAVAGLAVGEVIEL